MQNETEKTEIREMSAYISIQYHEGNQIKLRDLTKGKEPYFYGVEFGNATIHIYKNQVNEFKREMRDMLNRMRE